MYFYKLYYYIGQFINIITAKFKILKKKKNY